MSNYPFPSREYTDFERQPEKRLLEFPLHDSLFSFGIRSHVNRDSKSTLFFEIFYENLYALNPK